MYSADRAHCDHDRLVRQPYRNCYGEWVYRCPGCGSLLLPEQRYERQMAKADSEANEDESRIDGVCFLNTPLTDEELARAGFQVADEPDGTDPNDIWQDVYSEPQE